MKLEGLERLEKISTKRLITKEVLKNLSEDVVYHYSKYELEIGLALVVFSLFGNKEMHTAMNAKDINWVDFVDENYHLLEELSEGDYKEIIEELREEIKKGAKHKVEFYRSAAGVVGQLNTFLSEDNLKRLQDLANMNQEDEK